MASERSPLLLDGSVGALVTPMGPGGDVVVDDLARLVRRQCEAGSSAVMVLGTTGEARLLDVDERHRALRAAVEAADRPVLCGVGGESTAEVIVETERAEADGAAAVVVTPPAFFKLGPTAVERFVLSVADASPLPVLFDHAPGLTKLDPGVDRLVRLAGANGLAGIVDGSGDLAALHRLTTECPDTPVLIARAPLAPAALTLGAAGSLNPIGGYAPALERSLTAAVRNGDAEAARELHATVVELSQLIHSTGQPVAFNVKLLLAHDGLIGSPASVHPFDALSAEERREFVEAAASAGLLPSQLDEVSRAAD